MHKTQARVQKCSNRQPLKHHWGWGGFTTTDIKPCQFIARIIALIYNGWNIFARLANPDKQLEAVTSRPLLLSSVGRLTETGRKKTVTITSTYAKSDYIQDTFQRIQRFFDQLKTVAPQLTTSECWHRMLSEAMKKYRGNSLLKPLDDNYLST